MKIARDDIRVQLELPGAAVMRQHLGFGEVLGIEQISGEYFTLSHGVDTTPLFEGLEGDLCQCPHWGYVLNGTLTTTDRDGHTETVHAEDLFYWPPGHNVRVDEDAEIIMFSPQRQHSQVIGHMIEKVKG